MLSGYGYDGGLNALGGNALGGYGSDLLEDQEDRTFYKAAAGGLGLGGGGFYGANGLYSGGGGLQGLGGRKKDTVCLCSLTVMLLFALKGCTPMAKGRSVVTGTETESVMNWRGTH